MRRLSKTKIELDKILKANAKHRKMARGVKTPAGVRENQLLPSDNWAIELDGDADSWIKSFGGLLKLREAANDPENLELFANLLDAEHAIDEIRKILVDNFFDGDIEEKLMLMWYPDGTVTSRDQWSTDLKFDWDNADETSHTVKVLPFCNTGTASACNSDKTGVVVIPPYVETNGVRYAVVGVAGGIPVDNNTALTSIVAPTTITSVGDSVFGGCTSLATVSLPSATSIGDSAFFNCTSLASVSLPAATTIGVEAFQYCTSLASVSLPAATTIGASAFDNCTSLTSVSLPAATSIGNYAFYECYLLTTVSLPLATSIGSSAFFNCTSLTSVSFPAATSIGFNAFDNCTSLTSVSLPAATSIGDYAFYECYLLTTVSLPAVTSIGDYAFYGCTSLSALDLSSFRKDDIVSNAANWGINPPSGQAITIKASDETFTFTVAGE